MNLPACGCGHFVVPDARYCEWCGAQPPSRFIATRVVKDGMTQEEMEHFAMVCVAIGEALRCTRGKWGVA